MLTCPKCGSSINDNIKFCGICGFTVNTINENEMDHTVKIPINNNNDIEKNNIYSI